MKERTIEPHTEAATRRVLCLAGLGALLAAPLRALAVQPGQRAPAFSLPGLDGPVALEALRGRVVLLDFWASWCAPCKLSFPWMSAMQARHGASGLRVVAVNVDRDRAAAHGFLRAVQPQMTAPLAIAFDTEGATPERYGANAMPTSVLIGADEHVLLRHAGFRDADKPALEAAITSALAAAGRAAR
ncbi:MAG: TlpA family protein disulfide reductase [Betaproteobacteria bacterium]|nr:TlpA family protein disulfide reductase [Betaproteobacteria bacterium]MCC6247383.1 TlpA family protein disulfide reductase [Rubrivivax sp.]MCL4698033.1 TlpA family protein disulfide reductase [Burkholderiaceae bacterium]